MGCGGSKDNSQDAENNKRIEAELQTNKKNKEVKLLLLGAGESGKSTIFKNLKILYENGYNETERLMYKDIIFSNVLAGMKTMIKLAPRYKLSLQDDNMPVAKKLSLLDSEPLAVGRSFTAEVATDIETLWQDEAIQATYARKNEYQINDGFEYFMQNWKRITQEGFIPTADDVLHARVKTTGLTETKFACGDLKVHLVDVGGQRTERKKWIHCFSSVTGVIFVAAMSEYDQLCYEDETTNRVTESLILFDEIANSQYFVGTHIILFLNKTDLFKTKIQKTDLSVCFPEYKGGKDYDNASQYMAQKFTEKNKKQDKTIYVHFTCATDTNNIQRVFSSVKDMLLQNTLRNIGLLT